MRAFLWRLIGVCVHESTYRERRRLGDVSDVPHFVCHRCGQAWPCVSRTAPEHREMKQAGRPIAPCVMKGTAR